MTWKNLFGWSLIYVVLWAFVLGFVLYLVGCGAVQKRVDDVCDKVAQADTAFARAYEAADEAEAPDEVMSKMDDAGEAIVEVHSWCFREPPDAE